MFKLFSRFKKKEGLPVQRVERPGIKLRLKNPKKKYTGTVAIVFKGKPMRQFTITHEGYSRDKVAKEIQEQLSIKLISCVQDKPKRKSKFNGKNKKR